MSRFWLCLLAIGIGQACARGQSPYLMAFEAPLFAGSAVGEPLAGQHGFYVPSAGGAPARCFRYEQNPLGVVANPVGGEQFIACTRGPDYSRIQHDVEFTERCWSVQFDLNVLATGTLPTENYAGSISLQPFPGDGSLILLLNWDNVQRATHYTIRVLGHDAAGGVPFLAGLPVDSPAFAALTANHWYRVSLRVEFASDRLASISVRDLHDGSDRETFIPVNPNGYFLGGGTARSGLPSAFRIFAGGGFSGDPYRGNTVAIDNLGLLAWSSDCPGDVNDDGVVNLPDLAILLGNLGSGNGRLHTDGDLTCDGDVDLPDLTALLNVYGSICTP
jgi:hypothetical protein